MTDAPAAAPAPPVLIAGLADIADRYDVLLCDVWGVIHNGRESFPAACAALARFRKQRGPVILISNSPRPSKDVIAQLDSLGVPREAWSAFVTSGDATRALLSERVDTPAHWMGPERDGPLFAELGLNFVTADKAGFLAVTGLENDEVETPEHYRERLQAAAMRKLPMICANPDRVVQRGDALIYCAGALADLYESMGGEVIMAGKPFAPIYDLALAEAESLKGGPVKRSRVLCIGDGLGTDVKGANDQNLDVLFIATGIHATAAMVDGKLTDESLGKGLAEHGVHATWASADLEWGGAGDGELAFEDLQLGWAAETVRHVEAADIDAFAKVSGDYNPIHVDEEFAATTVFKSRIAHGMLSGAYISALMASRLPGKGSVYLSQTLRFLRPVRIGDDVTVRIEVVELDEKKAHATLKTTCRLGRKLAVDGEATVMVPRRGTTA
jgi:HAD superfamily hydrolase (TIGR01459 family)